MDEGDLQLVSEQPKRISKSIVFLISGILFLILIILIFFILFSTNKTDSDKIPEECYLITDEGYKNTCFAVSTLNSYYCENISYNGQKEFCYSYLAVLSEDSSLCEKTSTVDGCISNVASTIGDASLCNKIKISGDKNRCFFGVAELKNDSEICNKIESEDYKYGCFYNIAKRIKSDSICPLILDETIKNKCNALIKEDVSYCQNDEGCLKELAIYLKDSSICDKMDSSKDSCYLGLAMNNGQDYCDRVYNLELKSKCNLYIAIKSKNEIICEDSSILSLSAFEGLTISDKDICYSSLAGINENPSLCEKTEYNDKCYFEYVLYQENN